MRIDVDSSSAKDAKSVAFEGATSLMVVAKLKERTLRLIPNRSSGPTSSIVSAEASSCGSIGAAGVARLSTASTRIRPGWRSCVGSSRIGGLGGTTSA